MSLTHDDLTTLLRPFPVAAHTFNKRGFCYVKEDEVTTRLEEVDPAWQFEIQDVHRTGTGGQLAVVTARMTLKGISRGSTGMQAVEYTNQKDKNGTVIGKTETEAGEAEKGATTDALRRCARLFGVGRYILAMGESVKNSTQLEAWLKNHYPVGANNRQNNGNGQPQRGSQITDGSDELHKISGVVAVKIVQKGDKKWLEAGGALFFSRQPFRDAGYNADEWDKPGVYKMPEVPFTVYWKPSPDGKFKNGMTVVAE